jgi:hypothetical protein
MIRSNKNISDALDISFDGEENLKEKIKSEIIISENKILNTQTETQDTPLQNDFEAARKNIKELISSGMGAVDGILKVATESDSPRAYEVLTNMIKTMSDMNKDLIEIHEKLTDAQSKKVTIKNTTNNSIYVGSTTELQNLINHERSPLKVIEEEI